MADIKCDHQHLIDYVVNKRSKSATCKSCGLRFYFDINAQEAEDSNAENSVNHPKHYNAHPSGVECIDIVEHMSFNAGNAVKYIWRARQKGNVVEDLKKAKWYIEREIERLEKP